MATQGGFGLKIKITVASTLTAIAKITEGEIPEFERMVAEVTAHDSPNGWAEFISTGKRKMNEFKFTLLWDSTLSTHAAITAAFDSEAAVNMSVEDPDGVEVIAFAAFITKMGRISEQEEGYTCEVAVQPTGQPTIT
jgi:predicted secreted protein